MNRRELVRKLIVFNQVSLDGYFVDANADMSWAHKNDPEWTEFSSSNASGNGVLVFGRITYDLMASFWPSPMAAQTMPVVAEGMNRMQKIVFSRTLDKATWNNTRLIKDNLLTEIRNLKNSPGDGMVILGSGTIVSQLAQENLIDEYQVVVNPLVLGQGRSMFQGLTQRLNLKRTNCRPFTNGNVFLCYESVA
jgi:dihydrofolate reductase